MNRNVYSKVERMLKSCLKGKRKLTLALIITYLMTKGFALNSEEIINIQTPNNNGVSHNKFEKFSINENEAKIFNNSKENKESCSNEKEVEANKNLKDKEADIIIAEVTGKNKTNLEGTLEVLGKTADVIIANQNGITINGQKFINTNKVTLTTGRYDNSGNIDRKNVFKNFIDVKNDINVKDLGHFAQYLQLHSKNGIKVYKDNKDNLLFDTKALNIENGDSIYINVGKAKKRSKRSKRSTSITTYSNGEIMPRSAGESAQDYEYVELEDEEETEEDRKKKEEEREKEEKDAKRRDELKKQIKDNLKKQFPDISEEELDKRVLNELTEQLNKEKQEEIKKAKIKAEQEAKEREEAERKQREEEARRQQEEAEKLRKQQEEEAERKRQQEEAEKLKKEQEEKPQSDQAPKEEVEFDGIKVKNSSETKLVKTKDENTIVVDIKGTETKSDSLKVSHNKYEEFSVKNNKNVILNNNADKDKVNSTIPSKTDVEISKNENLKSEAAELIINEVENGGKSDLEGNLEVAGQEADVVIANKNGISVNGLNVYNVKALSLGASSINTGFKDLSNIFNSDSRKDVSFEKSFENKEIDLKIFTDKFTNKNKLSAKNISIDAKGDIENTKNTKSDEEQNVIAATEKLDLKAKKVKNEDLLSAKDINIEAKDVENEHATIFSRGLLILDTENLKNTDEANIFADTGFIRAKTKLTNNISTIRGTKGLVIRTPRLENKGQTTFTKDINDKNYYKGKTRRKEAWYKSWYNGYSLHITTPIRKVVSKSKDSTIEASEGHLVITGLSTKENEALKLEDGKEKTTYKEYEKSQIENTDAAILSKDHMYLKGDVKNTTTEHVVDRNSLLDNIKLDLHWNTQSLVDSSVLSKGDEGKGITLRQFLETKTDLNYGVYYDLLKSSNIPDVDRVLNLVLGGDWKDKPNVDKSSMKYAGSIKYLSPTSRATLSAGGRILIEGDIINSGTTDVHHEDGKRRAYLEKDAPSEYEFASQDILGEKPQVEKDLVKLDRYIVKENGFYVKSKTKEDKEKYLFKTSEYVKKEDIKVFSTLNSKVEKKADETKVKLIGDDTYQYNMIAKMLKDNNGYKLTPNKERIESLLKSSAEEANRLGLEIGKPLTAEQQSKLKRNIVWYVEKIVDGEKVLTPIVYLLDEEKHRIDNQEKTVSQIVAFEGVTTISKTFDNINSTVDGVKVVDITTGKLRNVGSKDTDAGISSGGKLNVKASEELLSEMAGLSALANIDIDAKKVALKASKVKAGGKVKIKAKEKVTIEDKKIKESTASLENIATKNHNTETITSSSRERSVGSEIEGDGIEIETEGKLEVKGSKLKSSKNIKLKGKKVDVLATKGKEKVHARSSSAGIKEDGNLDLNTQSTYERETDIINKSKVEAEGRVEIESDEDEDTDIKGSDIKAGKKAKITGKNVNIKNEVKREVVKRSDESADLLSYTNTKTSTEDITAEKSNVEADEIEAVAEKDVNVVASKLKSKRNYVKGKDGKVNTDSFEETHKSETSSVKVGYTANASAGAFGVGVKAEADSAEGYANAEAVNEYQEKRDKFRKTGISLANAEAGIKLTLQHKEREEKKHVKSDIIAEDGFNYLVGKKEVETGGSNIKAKGEVYVEADDIKATAKKDTVREESTGIDITLKQSAGTTSNVADLVNAASEIADDAKAGQLNKKLAAAKAAGALTNLVFGDVAGANSRQALAIRVKKSKTEIKEDTESSIESEDNITLAAKNKIELENTKIKAKKKASLQAGDDINIKAGKREEKSEKYEFGAEVRTQQTSGVSALFGANSQLGAGASADFEIEKKDNLTHKNSEVEGEEFELQSGNNINLEGVKVRAHKDGTTVAKKDLNLKSAVDKKDEYRAKASVGANISLGAGSNTIGAGNVNANASAGYIYDKGESIEERSSITAGKKLGVKVGKNLTAESSTIGSDTKQGELNVEGKIITKEKELKESAGGAIVGISGGITGEIGLDIEAGDRKSKRVEQKALIGFEKENIKAKAFEKNGKASNVDELETENESKVLENTFERGGVANLSFSLKDSKAIAKAGKKAAKKVANKVRETVSNAKVRRRRAAQQDPTYAYRGPETNPDSTYVLRGREKSQNEGFVDNDIYQSAGNAQRPLPKVPKGSRGEIIEQAAAKTRTVDTERIYDEVSNDSIVRKNDLYQSIENVKPNKSESGFVDNDIYQSAGNAQRPLPKAPKGSRGEIIEQAASKTRTVDTERIYDEISNKTTRKDPIYEDVKDIYSKASAQYELLKAPKQRNQQEPIYEDIKDIYTLRGQEQSGVYSKASGEYELLKAPKSRELPPLPDGSRLKLAEESARKPKEIETNRTYEEITNAKTRKEPIYEEVKDIYSKASAQYELLKAPKQRNQQEPIYEDIKDIYTLRGQEQSGVYSKASGEYELLKAPKSRELPKVPKGSRGEIIEQAARKANTVDTERIYDEISNDSIVRNNDLYQSIESVRPRSGFVDNDIYQSAGKAQRPLPKAPKGSRGEIIEQAARKANTVDTERIYDEISNDSIVRNNDLYQSIESVRPGSGFVDNDIYKSSESLARRELPKVPGEASTDKSDGIYSEIPGNTSTKRRRSRRDLSKQENAAVKKEKNLLPKVNIFKKKGKKKTQTVKPKNTVEEIKANPATRELPQTPDTLRKVSNAEENVKGSKDYETIAEVKAQRALPQVPENGKKLASTEEFKRTVNPDYESLDEVNPNLAQKTSRTKDPDYESLDEVRKVNVSKDSEYSEIAAVPNKVRVDDATSELYAKVNYAAKKPKVETEDEKRARINLENTEKYGAKRSIVDPNNSLYLTVQRPKKAPTTEDATQGQIRKVANAGENVKGSRDYETIAEVKAQRALPQVPENGKKLVATEELKRTVNPDYESLDEVRKVNVSKDSEYSEIAAAPNKVRVDDATSELYAKVNYAAKKPKVETEDEKRARINLENTEKYGAKRSIVDPNNSLYLTVQRPKKAPTTEDATQEQIRKVANAEENVKGSKDYETIAEVKAKRALPQVPENGKKLAATEELKRTVNPDYESLDEVRKVANAEENVKGSKDYETIAEVKAQKAAKESDYASIEDIRKILEAPEYDSSIKALGNTKYKPQELSKEQKEKLFAKQKQKAAKKDVHKEAIEKLKQIAKEKNIPTDALLRKLEEIAYGYSNEDVIKYVENSAKNGTNIALPDTVDKTKLNKKDRKILGDVFEKTKFSDNYDNFKKNVDDKIFDKLSTNSKFKELLKQDLSGNEKAIKELYDLVITAKKDAFKELAGIDIPVPKLVLENKGKDVKYHGHYLENVVTLNIKPPIKAKDKETLNKEILNTIIHELTHHDQANLADNKNNPNLPSDVRNESRLFGVNQDLYVTYDSHYHGYAKQPLEKDAFKSGDNLSEALIKEIFNNNDAKGIGNTKYLPKQYTKEEVKKITEEVKKKNKERDRAKEAEKKLEIIAKESKKLPKEHLLKAIEELAYGLSFEDNTALRNKAKENNTKINRPDTIEGFEGKNVDSFAKVFSNIKFDESYLKVREKVNENIAEKLATNKEFHELMNQKLSGNAEGIRKLFDIVKKAKADALYEETGIKSKDVELEINEDRGPLSFKQGYYLNNVVNMNKVPIGSFLRTKNQNNKEILDTIIHELTHHDQANFTRNKNSAELNPDIATDLRLLSLNDKYYIESSKSLVAYKKQPVEREAFLSGHKLSDKLIKVIENGYVDPNKKEIKTIEHLGGKVNNLETKREANSKLGDNALIYGLKDGRKELIIRANKADTNKDNAILADSYIGDLNLGFEFSRLSDFAKKVNENKVTKEDIDKIANFVDEGAKQAISDSRNRHNSVNRDDNKEIITELLKNETAVNALKKMDELNKLEQETLKDLKDKNIDIDDLDEIEKYNKEQKILIESYNAIRKGLNDTRMDFFAEKTKLIAKNTLESGGTIYFALDGLATDSTKFNNAKTKIDFEKLKELFDPKSPYYNSVTSKELRYLYDNFKNHPNVKFTIKDHVIENPFKNIEF